MESMKKYFPTMKNKSKDGKLKDIKMTMDGQAKGKHIIMDLAKKRKALWSR